MTISPRAVRLQPDAWRNNAACFSPDIDAELFFAAETERSKTSKALAICKRCPVAAACLTAAYAENDTWSIRGGYTNRQRLAFLRKANGVPARAVADATGDITVLFRHIYAQHAKPTGDGHVIWADARQTIYVKRKPFTVHQIAFIAVRGRTPVGQAMRMCRREGCVARDCLMDKGMRDAWRAHLNEGAAT